MHVVKACIYRRPCVGHIQKRVRAGLLNLVKENKIGGKGIGGKGIGGKGIGGKGIGGKGEGKLTRKVINT